VAELRELDVLDAWRRPPGTLDRWVRWAIAIAAAATLALPIAGARVLWLQGESFTLMHGEYDWRGIGDPFWFKNGLAILAGFWLALGFLPAFRLSRFMRLAIVLPIAHLTIVAVAWPVWLYVLPEMPRVERWDGIGQVTPFSLVLVAQLAVCSLAAWWIARRRRDASFAHAFVMVALVDLLVLGLWTPVASWFACHGTHEAQINPDLAMHHPARLVASVVAPPLLAAIAYTALAIRRPDAAHRHRVKLAGIVVALLVLACGLRYDATPASRVVYANFIPIMLVAMVVTCLALVGLAVGLWHRARCARERLARDASAVDGIVAADDADEPVVGCLEIASWLRGPRPLVRAFVVRTAAGDVPIHGVHLAPIIPASTTALRVGESLPLVRTGDRIVVAGLVAADGGPFRASAAPVAGPDVLVAPQELPVFGLADIALGLWRPALAYLAILVAVAGPALMALADCPR
jgi:hypothetical protein